MPTCLLKYAGESILLILDYPLGICICTFLLRVSLIPGQTH